MIQANFYIILLIWISLAIILLPLLLKVKAPYGRHSNRDWGKMIDNRTAWIIMELPSLVLFTVLFLSGDQSGQTVKWIFFICWLTHYINRVFIFPIRTRTRGKEMPVIIMILAMLFNLVNAFVNGYWLGFMTPDYYFNWALDPRFIVGLAIFIAGFIINQISDNHLIRLREKKGLGYFMPTHFLYNRVSCPNFGGEIMEWTGFAIMTWSLPGLSFALWTAANLIPRAIHHHSWYRETFPDYPRDRKAIIPGIL